SVAALHGLDIDWRFTPRKHQDRSAIFHCSDQSGPLHRIFLFGFSRGAYTLPARAHERSQQPRQILLILRSTTASSGSICSISLGLSDGTSLPCGWRWPTGTLPINRLTGASDEGTVGLAGPADDLGLPVVCAIATGPPSRANSTTVVIAASRILSTAVAQARGAI